MRCPIIVFMMLFLFGCNPEQKSRKKIKSLEIADQNQKYEIGIACMQYIFRHGDDLSYSKTLVKKLLDIGFAAEAISAVDLLLKKFPQDPELFFLHGVACRGQHQYDLAIQDYNRALKLQPQNDTFLIESRSATAEQTRWREIQSLNETLTTTTDSFHILLLRAEKFYALHQYDAVLYDLGSISKMGSPADSIYFTQKVSVLSKDARRPVDILSDMLKYYRTVEKK